MASSSSSKDPFYSTVNLFDDIFHARGDDDDAQQDELMDFDDIIIEMEQKNEMPVEPVTDDTDIMISNEEPSNNETTMEIEDNQPSKSGLPHYLSKKNQLFDRILNPLLQQVASTVTMEDLRDTAYLIHKDKVTNLYILQWQTYFRSGTGQLNTQTSSLENPLMIWPNEVKQMILRKKLTTARNEGELDHQICLKSVENYLRQLRQDSEELQIKLNQRKYHLNTIDHALYKTIEEFVQIHYINQFQLTIQAKMAIVEYDYKDRLIELDFLQLKHNEHQLRVFQNLTRSKRAQEQAKFDVNLLKQRVYYKQLPDSLHAIQIPRPSTIPSIINQTFRLRLYHRYEHLVQQTHADMVALEISIAEEKMRECQHQFDKDLDRMKQIQHDPVNEQRLTSPMVDIMRRRFKNLMEREFFRQSSDGYNPTYLNRRSHINTQSFNHSSPSIIIDTAHHLSMEQLFYLSRGPTYVPICQLHVSPSTLPLDEIWSKQMAPLRQQLLSFFTKYPISINRKITFQTEVKKLFHESFSTVQHLPTSIQQRAFYEQHLRQFIRVQLKKDQLILRRVANQKNIFYLGHTNDFQQQSNDYMNKHQTSYEMISIIDENNPLDHLIQEMIKSLEAILNQMYANKSIPKDHFNQIQVKKLNIKLPYLYFLPELQENHAILLQPIISSYDHYPLIALANFLHYLLTPLYDAHTQSTTLLNGMDLIQRLIPYEEYALLPRTRFVTIKIPNFYTVVSHTDMIDALGRFLSTVLDTGRYQHLSIDTIKQLTELILRNAMFTYDNHVYRYLQGSPLSLPLTRTLGNIYLHDWQTSLISKLDSDEDFYGRYYNEIIFTWNPPNERLQAILDELKDKYPTFQISSTIGSSVHILGLLIENHRGKLYTNVYHEPKLQRFVLPYVTDHPRLFYRQWFQWSLNRAIRYCTTIEDFDEERLYIELTLLSNGYSFDFIQLGLTTFFMKHSITTFDYTTYPTIRSRLIGLIQLEKQYRKEQKIWKFKNQLIHLSYLYDWGPRCLVNEKFKQLWTTYIKDDPVCANKELKLKLNTIHCYSLNALLTEYNHPSTH